MHYLKCQALSVRACTFCVITVLIFRVLTCRRDIPVLLNIIISTLLYPLKMWIMLVGFYWQCKLKKILLNDRAVRSSMSMWSYLTFLRPPQNSMRHHSREAEKKKGKLSLNRVILSLFHTHNILPLILVAIQAWLFFYIADEVLGTVKGLMYARLGFRDLGFGFTIIQQRYILKLVAPWWWPWSWWRYIGGTSS